jgi:hypothetical protein
LPRSGHSRAPSVGNLPTHGAIGRYRSPEFEIHSDDE